MGLTMAKIRAYTTVEQSRKLAEILPLESADMCWYLATKGNPKAMFNEGYNEYGDFELPCWSLAALLGVLPKGTRLLKSATNDTYHCDCPKGNIDKWFNNSIDACVAMIEKLNELKML